MKTIIFELKQFFNSGRLEGFWPSQVRLRGEDPQILRKFRWDEVVIVETNFPYLTFLWLSRSHNCWKRGTPRIPPSSAEALPGSAPPLVTAASLMGTVESLPSPSTTREPQLGWRTAFARVASGLAKSQRHTSSFVLVSFLGPLPPRRYV